VSSGLKHSIFLGIAIDILLSDTIVSLESVAKVFSEPTPAFRRRSRSYGGQVGHPSTGGEPKRLRDKLL